MSEVTFVSESSANTRPFSQMPHIGVGPGFRSHNHEIRAGRLPFCERAARSPHDIVALDVPIGLVALALAPAALEDLLVTRAADFEKSAMMTFTLGPLAGQGLFTSKGDLWRRQRKLMAPLFTPAIIDRYAESMVTCANRVVSSWKDGERIDLARECTHIAMSIAGSTLFDADTMDESDEIGKALAFALKWVSDQSGSWFSIAHIATRYQLLRLAERTSGLPQRAIERAASRLERPLFFPGETGRELRGCISLLDARVQRMIDDRRAVGNKREDLLSKLLTAHDADDDRMSDQQVKDEVLTLFVAGHETTASGLAWTISHLCQDRALYRQMQDCALAVGAAPGVGDLPKLGFALRAFKEGLRAHPPVYLYGRTAQRDTVVAGYQIPKWTHVLASPYATQRRASEWPNPDAFDPDRFLPEAEAKRPRQSFAAFGGGPRICIGNHFALLEAQLVLATIFAQCDFELVGDVVADPAATLRPREVPVVVRKRKAN
jgi:cytochrome P450